LSAGRLMLRTVAKDALAGGFDDIEVRVLVEAFDEAWKRILEDGDSLVGDGHAEATRELLALRIIEIAQLGERDPSRLRDDALTYLARTNLIGYAATMRFAACVPPLDRAVVSKIALLLLDRIPKCRT
jgi:hypothetical protein